MLDWLIDLPDRMQENESDIWLAMMGITIFWVSPPLFLLAFLPFYIFVMYQQTAKKPRVRIS